MARRAVRFGVRSGFFYSYLIVSVSVYHIYLFIIHKEGLCPSSGSPLRLMIMITHGHHVYILLIYSNSSTLCHHHYICMLYWDLEQIKLCLLYV
jgi:hypothetical protein